MGEYRSDPAVFAGYARARYEAGVRLRMAHVADSTGRCVSCNEVVPCAAAVTGQRWCREYSEWALPDVIGRGELVRPYVLASERGRDAQV